MVMLMRGRSEVVILPWIVLLGALSMLFQQPVLAVSLVLPRGGGKSLSMSSSCSPFKPAKRSIFGFVTGQRHQGQLSCYHPRHESDDAAHDDTEDDGFNTNTPQGNGLGPSSLYHSQSFPSSQKRLEESSLASPQSNDLLDVILEGLAVGPHNHSFVSLPSSSSPLSTSSSSTAQSDDTASSSGLVFANGLLRACILFGDSNFHRQFSPPFLRSSIPSLAQDAPLIDFLDPSLTFLRELSDHPRLEGLIIQTIRSHYVFLDRLLAEPRLREHMRDNVSYVGLPVNLLQDPNFQSFLWAHRSQLGAQGRANSVNYLRMFRWAPSAYTDLMPMNYLYSVARLSAKMLESREKILRNPLILESQITSPPLSSKALNFIRLIHSKVLQDLDTLQADEFAFPVNIANKNGLIWQRLSLSRGGRLISPDFFPIMNALPDDHPYAGAARRMAGLVEELKGNTVLFPVLAGLSVMHTLLLDYCMPAPLSQAYNGELLLNQEELPLYLIRNSVESVSKPPLVRAYMLKVLLDLCVAQDEAWIAIVDDLENYLKEPSVGNANALGMLSASTRQRCLAEIMYLLLSVLEQNAMAQKDRLSNPVTMMLKAFKLQVRDDLLGLSELIGMYPFESGDFFDDAASRKCREMEAKYFHAFKVW